MSAVMHDDGALIPEPAGEVTQVAPPVTDDPAAGCRVPGAEEEPEIVRQLDSHYRALLELGQLTCSQRGRLRQLITECEARLADRLRHPLSGCDREEAPGGAKVPRQLVKCHADAAIRQRQHQRNECLTAIRLYAAGARKGLAIGKAHLAAPALANIEAQVTVLASCLGVERCAGDEPEALLPNPCGCNPRCQQ